MSKRTNLFYLLALGIFFVGAILIENLRISEYLTYPLVSWDMYNDIPTSFIHVEAEVLYGNDEIDRPNMFNSLPYFTHDHWNSFKKMCAKAFLERDTSKFEPCEYMLEKVYLADYGDHQVRLFKEKYVIQERQVQLTQKTLAYEKQVKKLGESL